MTRRLVLCGVVAGLGALALLRLASAPGRVRGSDVEPRPVASRPGDVASGPIAGGPRDAPQVSSRAPAPAGFALAPSLRGTEVDGGLATDADGNFVPDREALALFDYFLSAAGEVPAEALEDRVRLEIETRLVPPARGQALALLDDYLAYRAEGRELVGDPRIAAAGNLERRFAWIRELRREHFGAATADALFGDEEAMVFASLEMRRIARDPDLSPAQRESRLAAVEEALPEHLAVRRQQVRAPLVAWQNERAMRAAGASDAEIHDYRVETFGPEAAARLAKLDRARRE